MQSQAKNINTVVDNFIGKRAQLEMLEHLSIQLKHADIVKTETLRKIVQRVNMRPVADAILELDAQFKAFSFMQLCQQLELDDTVSAVCFPDAEACYKPVFVQDDNLNTLLLLLALSDNVPIRLQG